VSIKGKARELLEKEVGGVLAYRLVEGSHVPHLFTGVDIDDMAEDYPAAERYALGSLARKLLAGDPDLRLAVVVRGCDERSIIELAKQGQLDPGRLRLIGLACDAETAGTCGCERPFPGEIEEGEQVEAAPDRELIEKLDAIDADRRLAYWLGQFGACIKCMGCKNVCPLCYCKECALEKPELVSRGKLPPTEPAFHLIRAFDMAGRCIDCGLCEEACPMGIPLRALYRKVADLVDERYDYRPGRDMGEKSPLAILGTEQDLK
jgi:ferredoxin